MQEEGSLRTLSKPASQEFTTHQALTGGLWEVTPLLSGSLRADSWDEDKHAGSEGGGLSGSAPAGAGGGQFGQEKLGCREGTGPKGWPS